MNHVWGPEPIHIVCRAVKPVIRKIIGYKKQNPVPPFIVVQVEKPKLIKKKKETKDECFGNQADHHITYT